MGILDKIVSASNPGQNYQASTEARPQSADNSFLQKLFMSSRPGRNYYASKAAQGGIDEQSALKDLARRMQAGEVNKEQGLIDYAGITGDYSDVFESPGAANVGGATGELVDRLMKENPDLSFSDALGQVQTGYRKGVTFGDGGVAPIEGLGTALGTIAQGQSYGKKAGELGARGAFEPKVEADIASAVQTAKGIIPPREDFLRKSKKAYDVTTKAAKTVIQDAGRALNLLDDYKNISGAGAVLSFLPETKAKELKGHIESIRSNIGIDKLLEIKASGSGLGQVPQAQLNMLADTMGKLDNWDNLEVLTDNVVRAQTIYADVIKAAREDFKAANASGDTTSTDFIKDFKPRKTSFDAFGNPVQPAGDGLSNMSDEELQAIAGGG